MADSTSNRAPARRRPTRTRQAHMRAHGRMPTPASGPACEGGARECEARC
ncbi:MAG: hypothetical protein NTX42_09020 [Methanothrix sp.]|nr:hypothetical protein [Methanothrix sp.]